MSHNHDIVDAGKHFVIDPALRTITTEATNLILVQGDHNSERYTFEIPQYVEGHDMSLCNRIEVHFDNISKSSNDVGEGLYIANDAAANGDVVNFSWLISGNATRLAGTISFWLNFVCVDDDGEVIYAWGTDVFKRVTVIESNRNTEAVVHTFPDLLEQWKKEVIEDIGVSGSTATIGTVELPASNWVASELSDRLHYQKDVTIGGVPENFDFENCQVDLTPSVEQLLVFYEKDLTFVTENEDGVITVYAIGQKPEHDYTIQVTITEVSV